MRLLIVGMLEGHISTAGQIAISRGATVSQVDSIESGLHSLRSGKGADLVMIDIKLSIAKFMKSMKEERLNTAVVACGISNDPDAAVAAIKAGAKEYIPLPPNPEMIAAVLEAVSEEQTSVIFKDPLMAGTLKLAAQIAPSEASVKTKNLLVSTVLPFLIIYWSPNFLVTKRVLSLEQLLDELENLKKLTEVHYYWMKLVKWTFAFKQNY